MFVLNFQGNNKIQIKVIKKQNKNDKTNTKSNKNKQFSPQKEQEGM